MDCCGIRSGPGSSRQCIRWDGWASLKTLRAPSCSWHPMRRHGSRATRWGSTADSQRGTAKISEPPCSDAQEDFATVHPEEDQPIDGEDGESLDQRLEAGSKNIEYFLSQVDAERVADEALEPVGDQIGRDRIPAD